MSSESIFWLRSFAGESSAIVPAPVLEESPPSPQSRLLKRWEEIREDESLGRKKRADTIRSEFPEFSTPEIIKIIQWKGYRFWINSEQTISKIRTIAQAAREKRSLKAEQLKSSIGGCQICGYNRCVQALEFHHRDPKEKSKGVTQIYDEKERELEIKKCVLLCANCHREYHAGLTDLPPPR